MIRIDGINGIDDATLSFDYMGHFSGEAGWFHPTVSVPTTELIFVTAGEVFLSEAGKNYTLSRGDAILLSPGVLHGGYRESPGEVAFTWLHFSGEHLDTLKLPKVARLSDNRFENRLREIGHLHAEGAPRGQIEAELLALLYAIRAEAMPRGNKLVADVKEYIRTRAAAAPTVSAVAAAFSYSPDHLSRLYRREEGISLKEAIAAERLSLCRRYLLTTSLSLGEIAALTAFPDANALTKFFTYHVGISPLAYRARVYAGHTNIK